MIPITRIDEYLAVISQDEDATGLPDQAITRIDTYLSKIAGEAVAELPEPVTRIDRYLASIAGMDVVMCDPITRIDYYLATVAGVYSGELPEPVTRIDYYLYNWANGGGMPDWTVFTGNPLQFNAPKAHTLRSVKVEFSPIQDLHGYANPWPPGGGKNKFNQSDYSETSDYPTVYSGYDYSAPLILKPNTTYTFKSDSTTSLGSGVYYYIFIVDGDDPDAMTPLGGIYPVYNGSLTSGVQNTFTTGATGAIRFGTNAAGLGNVPTIMSIKWQLEEGNTHTQWSPYSNECPITGWTGATVWDAGENLLAKPFAYRPVPSQLSDCFFIKEGTYTFSFDTIGTATSWRFGISMFDESGNALSDAAYKPLPSSDFVASVRCWYSGTDTTLKSVTITYIRDCYTRIWFGSGNTTNTMTATGAILNLGSTPASEYSPYTGETLPLTWTSEGTVYGGYLTVAEDGSVDLVATMAEVDLGTLTWAKNDSSLIGVPCFYATVPSVKAGAPYIACSDYVIKRDRNSINGTGQISPGNSSDATYCVIRDDRYATIDATAFKTAVSAVQLVYELANPVTYHLPSLAEAIRCIQGINTMWTDGDTLTIEARGEAVQLNALQSLNMLLGGRYYNNGTADEPTDEEALSILMGGER